MFTKSLIAISMLSTISASHASVGFYIGVNVGKAEYDITTDYGPVSDLSGNIIYSANIDDSDTSLSFTLGYQVNANLSFEGGYINLGELGYNISAYLGDPIFSDADISGTIETDGLFFDIKGQVPINEVFSVYGKFGLLKWETDMAVSAYVSGYGSVSGNESTDGDDVFYGIGGSFLISADKINTIALNIDYILYELDNTDVDVLSAGIQFGF
jgi:OOP family OmpA-OmpF porin